MRRLWYLFLLMMMTLGLLAPKVSWASSFGEAQTRIGGLDVVVALCTGGIGIQSPGSYRGSERVAYEDAVGSTLAARAGAVDPKSIRFTQDSIKGSFKSGGSLSETIEGLKSGKIDPESFPAIRTFERDEQVFTLDNWRLHVFQQAGVPIRTVPASAEEVASEAWKFTTKNGGESIRVRGQ